MEDENPTISNPFTRELTQEEINEISIKSFDRGQIMGQKDAYFKVEQWLRKQVIDQFMKKADDNAKILRSVLGHVEALIKTIPEE
jgi:hypothetical protein|tara:strand:- start:163 stop:417 length:255 start_codon:yes stop_codon:yes gene_type:complete